MQPSEIANGNEYILYDAGGDVIPINEWFESGYLYRRGSGAGEMTGRGKVLWFSYSGVDYVLRHYRRGGQVAHLSVDRYIWTGLAHTRAWREWHLLKHLYSLDLPVPLPVAARVVRSGVTYRADLITQAFPGSQTLAARLRAARLPPAVWEHIGRVIRRFHAAGLDHADLNAHNILVDHTGEIRLIDFDRGRLRRFGRGWRSANLERLGRSLRKLCAGDAFFAYREADFKALLRGYEAG